MTYDKTLLLEKRFVREKSLGHLLGLDPPPKHITEICRIRLEEIIKECSAAGITENEYTTYKAKKNGVYEAEEQSSRNMETCLVWLRYAQQMSKIAMMFEPPVCIRSQGGCFPGCRMRKEATEEQIQRFCHCQDVDTGEIVESCGALADIMESEA